MSGDRPRLAASLRRIGLIALWACAAHVAAGDAQRYCGAAVGQGGSGDPESVSDLSLEYISQQPASMMTCAAGYLLEKCGDHATANLVFDKCIAAGYAGAMIWKGLLYQDGSGVPQDPAKAAELFKRAAMSDDPGYAALGKVHYASALYEGKGVPRDEAEARKWFEAAAAEGSEDAREFLRTGHHTADRDSSGNGVGVARSAVEGQRLERLASRPDVPVSAWPLWLLAAAFAAGLLSRSGLAARSLFPSSKPQGARP